jgi:ABC-type polysaccharide/polyol phosphate export permease
MTTQSIPEAPSHRSRPPTSAAAQDLFGGLAKVELWGRLGWLDIKRRYRRTMIGPFWTSISLTLWVIAVGIVGVGLWHQDIHEYLPFLISGMVAWLLISNIITEACTLLVTGYALFRNVKFDYSLLAYALVWRNVLVFLHNLIVYVLIVAILKPSLFSFTAFLAIPGLLLIVANGAWIALLCGMFCLRFRDVTQLVASLLQISLLITPIFWPPSTLQGLHRVVFVETNPLFHLIDLVRAPLLGNAPDLISYAVVLGITVIGWLVTYRMFSNFRRRIAYWS